VLETDWDILIAMTSADEATDQSAPQSANQEVVPLEDFIKSL